MPRRRYVRKDSAPRRKWPVGGVGLVIRRKAGEAITIGEGIEIAVIEISPTRVKLGVSAPRTVAVARKELTVIAEDNRKAAEFAQTRGTAGVDDLLRSLRFGPIGAA